MTDQNFHPPDSAYVPHLSVIPKSGPNTVAILTTYFDFAYYLGFCSFRLKFSQNAYVIHSWLPQKLICGFINILICSWLLLYQARYRLDQAKKKLTGNDFVNLAFTFAAAGSKVATVHKYWTSSETFLNFSNFVLKNGNRHKSPWVKPAITFFAAIIAGLHLSCIILPMTTGNPRLVSSPLAGNLTQPNWWEEWMQKGRYLWFIDGEGETVKPGTQFTLWDQVIGFLALTAYLYR